MAISKRTRPVALYLLLAGLLFQGLSGLAGGAGLVADPSGRLLQMPQGLLEGAPFEDYLIPGLILFSVLGVFPLVAFNGLWRERAWAWPAALVVGIALVVWIGVEMLMIGYQAQPPLQLIYGLLGVVLLALVMLPSVREYYAVRRSPLRV